MSDYNNQGGKAPKKPKINEWSGEGIVKPRSGNDGDEIRFFAFQKGGGAIHITVACSEPVQGADENGQPRMKTSYIPVNVMTNRAISQQQLMAIKPGMRVRVVGKLEPESYTSKKTGQKVTALVVNAFVFEVLAMPQQAMTPQYGAMPQAQQPAYGAQPPYGMMQPQQQYPLQGGYPGPQYGAPVQPQYPPQQGYPGPQYQPQYQPQQPQAPAGAARQTPPYYVPPQGTAPAQPQQPQNVPGSPMTIEDMPEF